ncbi:uncharacterized protein LOC106162348 [Lingula anatina]|uniref:Uncharacterized protein LOC106162348 n=1 Tax=Lingula anatina TaxID=7574 RepID=A0A1S3I9Y9_LINAN|nr:uncharacterized protein LOC106162348 [Lingula anatina]|eukprot:XP_013395072.1 uncharacterized protein LOC106162348 [Lingula anatina]
MANYLGPESPRPFAVISETYRNRLKIPQYREDEQHSFGETWEENMFQLIHKHLELGTADRFCYIGEDKGSLVEKIEHKFCLLEPTCSVIPGCNAHVETICKTKRVSIPIAGVGAEEYFEKMARDAPYKGPSFDRVLLMDCIQYFENPREFYGNVMRTVSDFGKILVIHRPGSMNSLPYPRDALIRVQEKDHPYMQIIRDLQNHNFDVQWEIETLPIIMPKVKWLAMIRDRYPSQLEAISNFEVSAGMRELCEGSLKYEGEMIEFIDRLLFITASRNLSQSGMPIVKRWGNVGKPQPTPTGQALNLRLEVTPDIARYVQKKDWKPKDEKRYPYSGN